MVCHPHRGSHPPISNGPYIPSQSADKLKSKRINVENSQTSLRQGLIQQSPLRILVLMKIRGGVCHNKPQAPNPSEEP